MVCCVLIGLVFALPFIVARALFGAFGGLGQGTMAWRPALAGGIANTQQITTASGVNSKFTDSNFTIYGRLRSFAHAGRGAVRFLRFEHSAWIQLTLATAAVATGLLLQISLADWRWIVVVIGLVLSVEGLNTAIENTCDRITLEYSEHVKIAKDVAAGAVLLSSIAAALVGVMTFLPYLQNSNSHLIPSLDCVNPLSTSSALSRSLSQLTIDTGN